MLFDLGSGGQDHSSYGRGGGGNPGGGTVSPGRGTVSPGGGELLLTSRGFALTVSSQGCSERNKRICNGHREQHGKYRAL